MPRNKSKKAGTARTSAKRQQPKKKNKGKESMVSAPVATSRRVGTRSAKIMQGSKGDIRVSHTEFVKDILGSAAFTATSFPINPGQGQLFPWLSSIAQRYESYRFNSLCFELNTVSSTATTGTVMLTVDFDAADAAPTSKVQAMSYRSSVRDAPWKDLSQRLLPEDLHRLPMNFVRTTTALAGNLDIKTYDIGNLFVITQGQASAAAVSELYVTYDVSLITPQLEDSGSGSRLYGSAGLSATSFVGTNTVLDPQSTIPLSWDAAGETVTFLAPFSGYVTIYATGTVITGIATAGSTATVAAMYNSAGTNNTKYIQVLRVTATTAGQTLMAQVANTTFTSSYVLFLTGPADL